jgi:hypothetical protein
MALPTTINALTLTAQGAATLTTGDVVNSGYTGCHIVIDITTAGGTPTLTVTLEGKDEVSGKYYTILASAALATVATTVLRVFPGAAVSSNVSANDMLPRVIRLSAVVGGSTPAVTAKIGMALIG